MASLRIDPPLKSSAGWEAWVVSMETAFTLAYGSKGVPLSYVIRAQEAPHLNGFGQLSWEEFAVIGTPMEGLDYHADRMTVHLFILNNIGEDSDVYTYIQPILGQKWQPQTGLILCQCPFWKIQRCPFLPVWHRYIEAAVSGIRL